MATNSFKWLQITSDAKMKQASLYLKHPTV